MGEPQSSRLGVHFYWCGLFVVFINRSAYQLRKALDPTRGCDVLDFYLHLFGADRGELVAKRITWPPQKPTETALSARDTLTRFQFKRPVRRRTRVPVVITVLNSVMDVAVHLKDLNKCSAAVGIDSLPD